MPIPEAPPATPARNPLREALGLASYLFREVQEGRLSEDISNAAWVAWTQLAAATHNTLPVPDACAGPDRDLLYTWDRDRHHLELEILREGPAELFYIDRETDTVWECDYPVGDPIPLEALQKLQFFL